MQTRLLYLDNMSQLSAQAKIVDIDQHEEKTRLILDQTIFYPKGEGQPSDKGFITTDAAVFEVQSVVLENKIVYHLGHFLKGMFNRTEQVSLKVDAELRDTHSKIHTAGHLIDYALDTMGYTLEPAKAYHVPHAAYVEYQGSLDQAARERILGSLEQIVNKFVQQSHIIKIDTLDNNPEKRVIAIEGQRPLLCTGTLVKNTSMLNHVTVRKIKNEKGNLRVSFTVD